MSKIFVNTSTGKVLVSRDSTRNSKLCSTCCTLIFVPGDPPVDCCCFLDPNTPAWDSEVIYAAGDFVLGAVSGIMRSLQDNNLNHALGDTDWWEIASLTDPCGNAGWDDVLPFGGPGKTPLYYTITCIINWPVSGLKTTFYSSNLLFAESCEWVTATGPSGTDSDGNPFNALLDLRFGSQTRVTLARSDQGGAICTDAVIPNIGDTTYNFIARGNNANVLCLIAADGFGFSAVPVGCVKRRVSVDPDEVEIPSSGGDILIAWRPGVYLAWDSSISYIVGDCAAHEGVFYRCIAGHTNQEPPNASYWEVY